MAIERRGSLAVTSRGRDPWAILFPVLGNRAGEAQVACQFEEFPGAGTTEKSLNRPGNSRDEQSAAIAPYGRSQHDSVIGHISVQHSTVRAR